MAKYRIYISSLDGDETHFTCEEKPILKGHGNFTYLELVHEGVTFNIPTAPLKIWTVSNG